MLNLIRPRDGQQDRDAAEQRDANLAALMREDADAVRIFAPGDFTRCHTNPGYAHELTRRLERYSAAKHTAGRMDLYHQLFA